MLIKCEESLASSHQTRIPPSFSLISSSILDYTSNSFTRIHTHSLPLSRTHATLNTHTRERKSEVGSLIYLQQCLKRSFGSFPLFIRYVHTYTRIHTYTYTHTCTHTGVKGEEKIQLRLARGSS